ncbi:hypothetical protein NPIL_623361 [Nephila pilipes]|uniref:Uncharacterized protein n=1 Tax=Nephila pilipes TaxID=299642 RepID=A0A8X6TPI0_NEPPI|nr:hypothetical protein NPIL_623361 [Nephila pilipes]
MTHTDFLRYNDLSLLHTCPKCQRKLQIEQNPPPRNKYLSRHFVWKRYFAHISKLQYIGLKRKIQDQFKETRKNVSSFTVVVGLMNLGNRKLDHLLTG